MRPGLLALTGFLLLLAASWTRHDAFGSFVFDLGIHEQTMALLRQGQEPWLSTRGLHAFGDHFNPIAGVYALLPGEERGLLVVQALALALGVLPLYGLALPQGRRTALAWGLLYLVQPGLLWLNLFDFHFTMLLVPCGLIAAWALENARRGPYALALTAMLMTTESAGFTLLFLAPAAFRQRGRRWGGATLAAAVLGLAVASLSLQHYGQGRTQYLSLFTAWGDSGGAIVHRLALRPVETGVELATRANARYLYSLVAPVAGLCLLSPVRLLPAAPVVLGNLLTWRNQRNLTAHYTAGILPFVLWAAVAGARRVRRPSVRAVLLAVAFQQALWWGPLANFEPSLEWTPAGWRELVAEIPPGASVSADNHVGAQLGPRAELYVFPNPFVAMAWGNSPKALTGTYSLTFPPSPGELQRALEAAPVEYIALFAGSRPFPCPRVDRWFILDGVLRSGLYGVKRFDGALLLLERGLPPPREGERERILRAFKA